MQKKISHSLTTRIFIITLFLLVLMSGITYALIGIAMPASYRMELDSDLETQVFQLIEQLKQTTFEKSNLLFDRFLMNTNATLLIRLPDNTIISPHQVSYSKIVKMIMSLLSKKMITKSWLVMEITSQTQFMTCRTQKSIPFRFRIWKKIAV